jgi:hypothetical protein
MEDEKFIEIFTQGFMGLGVFFNKSGCTDYPSGRYIHRLEISLAIPFIGVSFIFKWVTLG